MTCRCSSRTCACSKCSTPTASRSAIWYCDYFKRDNKPGGAWMSNIVNQSKLLGTQARGLQRGELHQAAPQASRRC